MKRGVEYLPLKRRNTHLSITPSTILSAKPDKVNRCIEGICALSYWAIGWTSRRGEVLRHECSRLLAVTSQPVVLTSRRYKLQPYVAVWPNRHNFFVFGGVQRQKCMRIPLRKLAEWRCMPP